MQNLNITQQRIDLKPFLINNAIDIFNCRICKLNELQQRKKYNKSLLIHHINGDISNNNINNLAVLCSLCHFAIHYKPHSKITPSFIKKHKEYLEGKTWKEVFGEDKAKEMKDNLIERNKMLKGKKKLPFTEEHKKNISIAKLGKIHKSHTEEAKLKMSKTRKKLWQNPEYQQMMIKTNWKMKK